MRVALLVLIMTSIGMATWYWGFRDREPADDLGRLQGEWKLSTGGRGELDGSSGSVAVRITGDQWQYVVPGRKGKVLRIALHEETTPRQIELTFLDSGGQSVPGMQSHGVYEITGNMARVLVVPANRPRPLDLNASDAVVWVLTRVRLEPGIEQ